MWVCHDNYPGIYVWRHHLQINNKFPLCYNLGTTMPAFSPSSSPLSPVVGKWYCTKQSASPHTVLLNTERPRTPSTVTSNTCRTLPEGSKWDFQSYDTKDWPGIQHWQGLQSRIPGDLKSNPGDLKSSPGSWIPDDLKSTNQVTWNLGDPTQLPACTPEFTFFMTLQHDCAKVLLFLDFSGIKSPGEQGTSLS